MPVIGQPIKKLFVISDNSGGMKNLIASPYSTGTVVVVDDGGRRFNRYYLIEVTFNNGKKGSADLSDALQGPMFEPLKDLDQFVRFTVHEALETISWENGADLAPEFIYFQAFKTDAALKPQFQAWGCLA